MQLHIETESEMIIFHRGNSRKGEQNEDLFLPPFDVFDTVTVNNASKMGQTSSLFFSVSKLLSSTTF